MSTFGQQRLDLGSEREVVERDQVAAGAQLPQGLDQRLVDELVLEQLQDDAIGRDGLGQTSEDELAGDVDPRPAVVDEALEVDLGHGPQRDQSGGELVVSDVGVIRAGLAIQQLISDRGEVAVEDRLAGQENLWAWARAASSVQTENLRLCRTRPSAPLARDVMRGVQGPHGPLPARYPTAEESFSGNLAI